MCEIDIIMASYNGEKYIKEQIHSILNSSIQDFKINIYDDGSNDATIDILEQLENQYKDKIKVYKNSNNKGVTRNFLEALSTSSANYIMFCDQDDYWLENKIEITLNKMKDLEKKHPNKPLAVFTDTIVVDEGLNTIYPSFFKASNLNPEAISLEKLLMENKLIGCTVMINKEVRQVLNNISLPKEAKFHDHWIALIAASMGVIGYIDKGTLLYRQHGDNVVGNLNFKNYLKDRIKTIKQQKQSLIVLQKQANEFASLYKDSLSKEAYKIIIEFSKLRNYNYFKRIYTLMKYGYYKTGILRNIGLFVLI